jgi:acyl-coenzyme A thioesterase PaaI-like protein
MMHGGIIFGLIDSAMTHCLFGHGIIGYTVRLNIKYLRSIDINSNIKISVELKEKKSDYFVELDAFVFQENKKKVKANSKFWIVKKEDL